MMYFAKDFLYKLNIRPDKIDTLGQLCHPKILLLCKYKNPTQHLSNIGSYVVNCTFYRSEIPFNLCDLENIALLQIDKENPGCLFINPSCPQYRGGILTYSQPKLESMESKCFQSTQDWSSARSVIFLTMLI